MIPITVMGSTTRMDYIGIAIGGSFIGMLATVYVLIIVAAINYITPRLGKCDTFEEAAFVNWMHIEIFYNLAIVISNMIFMAVRACLKHKVEVDRSIDEKKKLPFIDTLAALTHVTGAWNTEMVPLTLSNALWWGVDIGPYRSEKAILI